MSYRMLTADTWAHVCITCGRDSLPRRTSTSDDLEEDSEGVAILDTPGPCTLCNREMKTRGGICSRCRTRIDNGIQAV